MSDTEFDGQLALTPQQECFKDWKFGVFIHWSLFSLPTGHQDWRTPDGAFQEFRAERFEARRWIDAARTAGARYVTFTTKHHDGFCLFSSGLSDFNSTNSPAGEDFVRLLSDECRRQGMPLFLYYSLPDLNHPSFLPGSRRWQGYVEYYQGQIAELCRGYGRVAGFWLDPGPWHGPNYDYALTETQGIIRDLQPHALVMGRDFFEAEKDLPTLPGEMGYLDDHGEGVRTRMGTPSPHNWPFEVCDTMNDSWHFNASDTDYKSPELLIRKLVKIVGMGGNYLLNMSPTPSGQIHPEQARILSSIGAWLSRNGDSLYETRPLGQPPVSWGAVVRREDRAFLHVLEPQGRTVELRDSAGLFDSFALKDGPSLESEEGDGWVRIHIPSGHWDPVDTMIVGVLAEGSHVC